MAVGRVLLITFSNKKPGAWRRVLEKAASLSDLQICSGIFAALAHDVETDVLTFIE